MRPTTKSVYMYESGRPVFMRWISVSANIADSDSGSMWAWKFPSG